MESRERKNREPLMMMTENRGGSSKVMKPTLKKIQVVYYLSKNGLLEHPHFLEVTHFGNHSLRLKDVLDRLKVLRGKGMPSLYSWSCKRCYKNGYVWNDLAENDVIYPSEGADFVLKGSKIIESCNENFQQMKIENNIHEVHDPLMFNPKRKMLAAKRHQEGEQEVYNNNQYEEKEYEEKTTYNSQKPVDKDSSASNCRRFSRISAGKTETINTNRQLVIDNSSPPSAASSTNSEKTNENNISLLNRFDDRELTGSWPSGGSLIRQLIACGGGGPVNPVAPAIVVSPARKSSSLHKGVLCKTAASASEEDVEMIKSMSENSRFGNVQAEEKEYFSGSIVEGINKENGHELQKSSSYNEERSSKADFLEERPEEDMKRDKVLKARCLPIMMPSSKHSRK